MLLLASAFGRSQAAALVGSFNTLPAGANVQLTAEGGHARVQVGGGAVVLLERLLLRLANAFARSTGCAGLPCW